ncbi:MAG: hypothetical protein QOJ42_147, partial [Acidobacteriaceae bacterium]|nr:hypothetical protein [Acidobacteriaceae bacterium]
LPTVLLKHTLTRQTLLLHQLHLATIRLINRDVDAELVQRFPSLCISTIEVLDFNKVGSCMEMRAGKASY